MLSANVGGHLSRIEDITCYSFLIWRSIDVHDVQRDGGIVGNLRASSILTLVLPQASDESWS